MKLKHRQNKDSVIKMLIDDVFNVDLSLPQSIINRGEENNKRIKKSED